MPALLRSVFRSGTVAAGSSSRRFVATGGTGAGFPPGPTTVGAPPTSATAPTVSAAPAVATTSTRPRVVVLDPATTGATPPPPR